MYGARVSARQRAHIQRLGAVVHGHGHRLLGIHLVHDIPQSSSGIAEESRVEPLAVLLDGEGHAANSAAAAVIHTVEGFVPAADGGLPEGCGKQAVSRIRSVVQMQLLPEGIAVLPIAVILPVDAQIIEVPGRADAGRVSPALLHQLLVGVSVGGRGVPDGGGSALLRLLRHIGNHRLREMGIVEILSTHRHDPVGVEFKPDVLEKMLTGPAGNDHLLRQGNQVVVRLAALVVLPDSRGEFALAVDSGHLLGAFAGGPTVLDAVPAASAGVPVGDLDVAVLRQILQIRLQQRHGVPVREDDPLVVQSADPGQIPGVAAGEAVTLLPGSFNLILLKVNQAGFLELGAPVTVVGQARQSREAVIHQVQVLPKVVGPGVPGGLPVKCAAQTIPERPGPVRHTGIVPAPRLTSGYLTGGFQIEGVLKNALSAVLLHLRQAVDRSPAVSRRGIAHRGIDVFRVGLSLYSQAQPGGLLLRIDETGGVAVLQNGAPVRLQAADQPCGVFAGQVTVGVGIDNLQAPIDRTHQAPGQIPSLRQCGREAVGHRISGIAVVQPSHQAPGHSSLNLIHVAAVLRVAAQQLPQIWVVLGGLPVDPAVLKRGVLRRAGQRAGHIRRAGVHRGVDQADVLKGKRAFAVKNVFPVPRAGKQSRRLPTGALRRHQQAVDLLFTAVVGVQLRIFNGVERIPGVGLILRTVDPVVLLRAGLSAHAGKAAVQILEVAQKTDTGRAPAAALGKQTVIRVAVRRLAGPVPGGGQSEAGGNRKVPAVCTRPAEQIPELSLAPLQRVQHPGAGGDGIAVPERRLLGGQASALQKGHRAAAVLQLHFPPHVQARDGRHGGRDAEGDLHRQLLLIADQHGDIRGGQAAGAVSLRHTAAVVAQHGPGPHPFPPGRRRPLVVKRLETGVYQRLNGLLRVKHVGHAAADRLIDDVKVSVPQRRINASGVQQRCGQVLRG